VLQGIGVLFAFFAVWLVIAYLIDEHNLAKQREQDGPPLLTEADAESALFLHHSISQTGEGVNLNLQSAATYSTYNSDCNSRYEYAFVTMIDDVHDLEVKRIALNYCVNKFNGQVRAADSLTASLTNFSDQGTLGN